MFNRLKKIWVGLVLIFFIQVIVPISHSKSIQDFLLSFGFEMTLFWGGFALSNLLSDRLFNFKWGKASDEELKVEDTVLLEGTGIFQGTLFIYMSLTEKMTSPTLYRILLQWSIPIISAIVYLLRGYGAIKNSPRHRYHSSMILIYYVTFQICSLIIIFISSNFPIYIGSENIVSSYLPLSLGLIVISFNDKIRKAFRDRYY